jgi:L-alanine-DL-glutamate epimerase-like enolase superfamily enzyme
MTQSISLAKIDRLEVIPLASPDSSPTDLDGTTDTLIVKIFDENGQFGMGETDAPLSPEPEVKDGFMALPDRPGLGIELNDELVERLRTDRRKT